MAPPPSSRRRRNRVAETPDSPASSSSTPATTKKATSTTKVAAAAPLEVDIAATTTNTHANSSSSHWRNWCLPSLVPHWQAHARQQQQQWINDTVDSNSHTNTARRVAAIHTSFQEAVLARSLSRAATLQVITTTNNTGKDGEENKDEDETNQQWVWKRCLCHFIDCALAASELKNSSNSTSSAGVVAALLELTVQVAAAATGTQSSSSSVGMLHAVTEHLMPFAMHCPVESVRRAATGALGAVAVAACAAASSSSSWTIRMEDDSDDSDSDGSTPTTSIVALLDALQQALLSRLTDTAVSVRCAALHAVFGPTHFSTTTSSSSSSRIPPPPPMATDPDLRQAGVWILQHDSSAANRAAAARLLPVTVHTVDAMVCRLRDTHAAVRQAASAALFAAAPPGGTDPAEENGVVVWQSHHFTEILSTGLTPRCAVTRQTTRRGIITSWLPAVNYDPVRLLQCIGFPDAHSLAAATALLNLWQTAETWIGEDSSGDENTDWYIPHRAAMQRGLEQATNFSISDLLCSAKSDSSKDDCDIPSDVLSTPRLPLERLFVVRSVLTHPSTAPLKREALFARVVPDIPVLCQVLQDCAARLVQTLTTAAATNTRSFNAQDDQQQQVEDDLVFVCCELLQLATISHHHNDKVNDGKTPGTFMEEGSRRIFAVAMKKLLTNLVTPCDLIEPCCQALLSCCCNEREVETDILAILQHLVTENDAIDELRENVTLRILSILTVVFESALSPSQHHNHSPKLIRHDALMVFASHIVPAVSSSNALIREAAVSCLGRFGFVSFVGGRVNDVTEKYLPLLYTVAVLEEERMEIRLQAIMALMDWSLFFVGRLPRQQSTTLGGVSIDARMYDLIRDLMDPSIQSVGTVCIAAEIATKCLLSPQWEHFLHDWLARLVWLYFVPLHNSGGDNEDDDVERVGSPIRLQQVMSTFFPTLCTMSPSGRNALTESIATLLQIAATPKGIGDNRRGKKAKLPLVTKMLDFVVSMVENGLAAQMQTSSKQPFLDSALEKDAATSEASPCLLAAVQVATFLTENSSNLSTTTQRGLCKWIGNISLANIEKEQWEHLSLLKNLVEELVGNVVDDDAQCLESLYRVEELLADVEVEEEVVSDIDEDDDKELIEALKPMIIAGPGIDIENQAVVVALSATCKAAVLVGNEKYRPITAVSRSKGSNPFSELLE